MLALWSLSAKVEILTFGSHLELHGQAKSLTYDFSYFWHLGTSRKRSKKRPGSKIKEEFGMSLRGNLLESILMCFLVLRNVQTQTKQVVLIAFPSFG